MGVSVERRSGVASHTEEVSELLQLTGVRTLGGVAGSLDAESASGECLEVESDSGYGSSKPAMRAELARKSPGPLRKGLRGPSGTREFCSCS